jgi:cell shape-determining protein MreD
VRTATIVLVAYGLLLVLGSVWRTLPIGPLVVAIPDLAAITAAYLGLTARRGIAQAVGGAVVVGYLGDLIAGAPAGLGALIAGIVCILGYLVQRRLLVRGWAVTLAFSGFTGAAAGLLSISIRAVGGQDLAPTSTELLHAFATSVATALVGPLVLRLLRRIDAAFARTHRERDQALEGIA